ncbi:unnamed protein product [Closterium sp. NIES-53]
MEVLVLGVLELEVLALEVLVIGVLEQESIPPVLPHDWTTRCPHCARPSSPFDDLHTVLFRSSSRRDPPVSVLPPPPASSLTNLSHPITDYYRVARPIVSRVPASLVTDPRASPSSVSALTATVADIASTRRLDFDTRVVAAPPARPLSARDEFALGCVVLEDRQFELEFLATTSPSLYAMLLSPEGDPDALDIPTPRTYCTYVNAVPPPRANVVDGMWLFKGVDFFQSFTQTPKTTTLRVLLHVAAQRDHELHFLDFSTAFLQGRLHEEIWLGRPAGFTDTFPPGTQWSLRRPVYPDRAAHTITLTPSHMVQQVLRRFEFQFSTTQPTPLAVGPFPDEPFESSGPYAKLMGCLMYLMTCIRPDLAFPLSVLSRFVATGRHCPIHWTAAVRVAKNLATTSGMGLVLGGTQPVELTGHCESSYADDAETQPSAMATQELRWLTFLLADLRERPRSARTLYGDNKAMILLCREPRLESRMKHIDVRYFLLRELQRRGQAHLEFVANTADVFTKALAPGDHHR